MFKQAVIHYPTDESAIRHIHKELASFQCIAAVKYIESLNLTDRQIEVLYDSLANDIKGLRQKSA